MPVPLPPSKHNNNCVCSRCFEQRINPFYSVTCIESLARELIPLFGPRMSLWFLVVFNDRLPDPLCEVQIHTIVDAITNGTNLEHSAGIRKKFKPAETKPPEMHQKRATKIPTTHEVSL